MHACTPKVNFKEKQLEFTAYIKDPFNNPIPEDVKPQRMNTYRELFFNNVEGFLSSNFPVLKNILTKDQWFELVQDFFANHASESPYFSEIPEEFLAYLQNERKNADDYPFLLELAHYEWVEMALSIAKDTLAPYISTFENLSQQTLQLSPLVWSLAYQYPVQEISPENLPLKPPVQATYLIVYRNRDDAVNFIQTTAVTYRLLQLIEKEPRVVDECLQQIATEMNLTETKNLISNGLEIIENLIQKEILFIAES
jgi:hypothetical protein